MFNAEKYLKGLQNSKNVFEPLILDIWNDCLERRFSIENEISLDTISSIIYGIMKYNKEDNDLDIPIENRNPIKIYINSFGGELYPTMSLIDMIKMSKTPVYTIVEGTAYSSAGLILLAGHKRFAYPSASFLLHSGSFGAMGKTDSVFDQVEFNKKYEGIVKKHVISCSNITNEFYEDKYRKEWYILVDEMLEYGIIDVITNEIIF